MLLVVGDVGLLVTVEVVVVETLLVMVPLAELEAVLVGVVEAVPMVLEVVVQVIVVKASVVVVPLAGEEVVVEAMLRGFEVPITEAVLVAIGLAVVVVPVAMREPMLVTVLVEASVVVVPVAMGEPVLVTLQLSLPDTRYFLMCRSTAFTSRHPCRVLLDVGNFRALVLVLPGVGG